MTLVSQQDDLSSALRKRFYSPAFEKATDIRQQKRHDYGGDLKDYFPFGDKSYVHEIHKKATRLVSLTKNNIEPNFESITDNLVDLINYCAFYYEHLVNED